MESNNLNDFKAYFVKNEITLLLGRVAKRAKDSIDKEVIELGINTPQIIILFILSRCRDIEINQKFLANILEIKNSSVSSIINSMLKRELITKIKNEKDGRSFIIDLTEKGMEIAEIIKNKAFKFEEEIYSNLTAEEKDLLIKLLRKI